MNYEELIKKIISNALNQSLINREKQWVLLPQDQQKALNDILDAIHDVKSNMDKIEPKYRSQATDAMIIKLATEFGMINGGNRQ